MSVSDAEACDIYVDAHGKLWRCIGIITQPAAIFESVEQHISLDPTTVKDRTVGAINAPMWDGWKRIHRP